ILERPMDPFLDYALWLTINELATPWLEAVRSGAWEIAGRERQLEFGLRAVEPALAGEALGEVLAQRPLPRDGSGPWIELIGTAGGPAELGRLLELVVAGNFEPPAAARALDVLAEAARLREVRPDAHPAAFATLFSNAE